MPNFQWAQRSLTAKVLAVSAIGMSVGFGICGLGFFAVYPGSRLGNFTIWAGLILFYVSFAALVFMALVALGIRLAELFRK